MTKLPLWKCHKVVQAARILDVLPKPNHEATTRTIKLDGKVEIDKSCEWIAKHSPQPGGFLVRYEDGYESYSPKEAFENGYSTLESVEKAQIASQTYMDRLVKENGELKSKVDILAEDNKRLKEGLNPVIEDSTPEEEKPKQPPAEGPQ